MNEEVLLLKIHNAIDRDKKDFYEAVQGNWKLSERRIPNIKFVVGIYKKKAVCVFVPTQWETVLDGPETGRKRFEGKEAPIEVLNNLQQYNEVLLKRFGSGSAVAYILLSELDIV